MESVLKGISAVGSGGSGEVNVIKLRRKLMPGCQGIVADSSMLCETYRGTLCSVVIAWGPIAAGNPSCARWAPSLVSSASRAVKRRPTR